jgi:hypothetical protein
VRCPRRLISDSVSRNALSSSPLSPSSSPSPRQGSTDSRLTPPSARKSSQADTYQSIFTTAAHLEARLAKWPMFVPPSWQPITVSSTSCIDPSITAAGLYGASCDIYPSINIAGSWNWYRTLRISTIKIMIMCLRKLKQRYDSPSVTPHLTETAQVLIDEFCASIPFHLGNRSGPMLSHELWKVTYPSLPIRSINETDGPRCATATSTAEHKRAAACSGAWFVLDPLSEIMKATAVSAPASPGSEGQAENKPLLSLRAGQREWLMGQMLRVQSMNLYGRAQSSQPSSKASSVSLSTSDLSTPSLKTPPSSASAQMKWPHPGSREHEVRTTRP